jgi:hypothetical protein
VVSASNRTERGKRSIGCGNVRDVSEIEKGCSFCLEFRNNLEFRKNVDYEVKLMTVRQPRYSKEEFARRGNELYASQVQSQVEEANYGKIVAIDIETGAFEVAEDSLTAAERLFSRRPDAQPWCIRIGHAAVHRFGYHSPAETA